MSTTMDKSASPEDELFLFIGHADDAKQEAQAVYGLEGKLKDEFGKIEQSTFTSFHLFLFFPPCCSMVR